MKKLIYFLTFISILVLNTGCEKSSAVTAVTTGLSFSAEISNEDIFITCDAEISKNGNTEFTVTSPEAAAGLTLGYNGGKTVLFEGLEYNGGNLEQYNPLDLLYKIFEDAESNKNNVTKSNKGFVLRGKTDSLDYEITLGESGLPIKITTDSGMQIIIKNAKITDN